MFKKVLLGALTALAFLPAMATSFVYSEGTNSFLADSNRACAPAIAEKLKPEHRDKFRGGTMQIDGKEYNACWIQVGEQVFVIDEDYDTYVLPASGFHTLKEV